MLFNLQRPRKIDSEDAAFSGQVPHSHFAVERLDRARNDREPKSYARSMLSPSNEGMEELFGLARGQASTLVLHLNGEVILIRKEAAHDDTTSVGRVFDGVLEQVAQDRDKQLLIGFESQCAVNFQVDLLPTSLSLMN